MIRQIIETFLIRGLNALKACDIYFKELIDATFNEGFCLELGVLNEKSIFIKKCKGKFKKVKPQLTQMQILFKSVDYYNNVLMAKNSVHDCYNMHQIMLQGNINQATVLVELINQVEMHLFPRSLTKNILPDHKKSINTFKFYIKTIF